jgi:hypothetical protein
MKFWHIALPLLDTPGDTGAGGGGTPAGTPGAGATGAGAEGQAGASGTPGAAGTAGTTVPAGAPGAKQFTYAEDRTDWIPRHRFNEVSQRAQKAQTLEQQLQESQRRIQALAGVAPQNGDEPEAAQVREAFGKLFPHLAKLDDKQIEKIMRLAEQGDQIESTTQHYWKQRGQEMVGRLEAKVAETLGADELSPRQKQRLGEFYVASLNRDHAIAQREGRQSDLVRRHEQGDPKLIEELAKEFEEDFIAPVRRHATVQNVNRVTQRVPGARGSQNARTTSKPSIDFKDEKAVEDAAVEAFRAHGGMFRR